ncbi:tRNA (adenosine(37)-N6)-dimethylallyltransferase MiaA [Geofilum sp. OHC36d9]|uniref:tRNA (adenosine(37)-N6)-dimethylallyltransferase MiaA n=1 Tax=Geofilum sp. OHC36d9 TaxID=3458413 RepID=UPI00403442E0
MTKRTMVVITGPTGVGKTNLSIDVARHFKTNIISADSRQIYKEIPIGTAAPTAKELEKVPHYMVGIKSVTDYYNAYEFEQDAIKIASQLFKNHEVAIMTGGSMMYIDAFCNGIDELPTIDPELRDSLMAQLKNDGLESIRQQLKYRDPIFYGQVDLKNPKRIIHALEICLMTGRPYSELRTQPQVKRPFNIIKIGLTMDRDKLYERINQRVLKMIEEGLEAEAKLLLPYRDHNALNTVGFKELFAHFDGDHDLARAIELIQRNSRRYAKKQLSWFRRDPYITWFQPDQTDDIIKFIETKLLTKD